MSAPSPVTTWKGWTHGWYGEFLAAFDAADIFGRFTKSEREALARVAAERVHLVQTQECGAGHTPGPGRPTLHCEDCKGHPGDHWASTSAPSSS